VLPKVKSWRDAGKTLCRKDHQEEAKLWHLHTPSPCIASPLHVKWRNKEGSHTARCQLLPVQEKHTTRWAKWHVVLPQTTLGQISIDPWTDWPPPREKREKNKWNKQQQQQKTHSKEGGVPWALKRGEGQSLIELYINKPGQRRQM
jgi:hypothetical protein